MPARCASDAANNWRNRASCLASSAPGSDATRDSAVATFTAFASSRREMMRSSTSDEDAHAMMSRLSRICSGDAHTRRYRAAFGGVGCCGFAAFSGLDRGGGRGLPCSFARDVYVRSAATACSTAAKPGGVSAVTLAQSDAPGAGAASELPAASEPPCASPAALKRRAAAPLRAESSVQLRRKARRSSAMSPR
jgi:hypothetical protein